MAEEHDLLDDESAQHARVEERKRLQRDREVDDFKWLMGHRQGRRFMWRLLSITGLYHNAYRAGEVGTEFRCGEQNVGQQLMAEIHSICPERYNVMTEEHQQWLKSQQQ